MIYASVEAQRPDLTMQFIENGDLDLVVDDGAGSVFGQFATQNAIPQTVIINGRADAQGLEQWEVLYNSVGYPGADAYKEIIDSVDLSTGTGGGGGDNLGSNLFAGLPEDAVGGGWRQSPWFGWLAVVNPNWNYHDEHDWIYIPDNQNDGSMFYYKPSLGWVWTNSSNYPSVYAFDQGGWLFYEEGSKNRYFNFDKDIWENY